MNIEVKNSYETKKYAGVEDMVVCRLDGAAHGNSQIETIQDTARNNSKAMGRLLFILYKEKKLSLKEILKICDGYVDSDTKIRKKK